MEKDNSNIPFSFNYRAFSSARMLIAFIIFANTYRTVRVVIITYTTVKPLESACIRSHHDTIASQRSITKGGARSTGGTRAMQGFSHVPAALITFMAWNTPMIIWRNLLAWRVYWPLPITRLTIWIAFLYTVAIITALGSRITAFFTITTKCILL